MAKSTRAQQVRRIIFIFLLFLYVIIHISLSIAAVKLPIFFIGSGDILSVDPHQIWILSVRIVLRGGTKSYSLKPEAYV